MRDRDSIFEYEHGQEEMLWADVDDIRKAHILKRILHSAFR